MDGFQPNHISVLCLDPEAFLDTTNCQLPVISVCPHQKNDHIDRL